MTRHPLHAAALAVTFVAAAATGAYAHWVLWLAVDALMTFLAAGASLVGALTVAVIPRPAVRRLSLFPLLAAVGLVVGQSIGPTRPLLLHTDAVVTGALERPGITTGEGRGSCQTAGGSELQVTGSLRLDIRADDPSGSGRHRSARARQHLADGGRSMARSRHPSD
jgi:hypothetical protein